LLDLEGEDGEKRTFLLCKSSICVCVPHPNPHASQNDKKTSASTVCLNYPHRDSLAQGSNASMLVVTGTRPLPSNYMYQIARDQGRERACIWLECLHETLRRRRRDPSGTFRVDTTVCMRGAVLFRERGGVVRNGRL
jgi:hypothetical protein